MSQHKLSGANLNLGAQDMFLFAQWKMTAVLGDSNLRRTAM